MDFGARAFRCSVLIALASSGSFALAGNWPQLGGPNRDGVIAEADLPDGGMRLEVVWKKPLGSGYSGISVEGGRAVQEGTPAGIRRHPATPYVAELTGTNLLSGALDGGTVTVEGTGFELTTASPARGPVTAVIDPRAVSLHLERPEGSPRNTWCTTIDWIEPLGLTARVRLGAPLPLMVDITQSSAAALGLGPGRSVWAAVKATEIAVRPR